MSTDRCTECFFQPPAGCGYAMGNLVDFINPDTGRSLHSDQGITDISARYPGVEVWLIDAAINFREQAGRSEPQEIAREVWINGLEVLPPDHWERQGPFESFQCSEHFSGRLTATYLRRGQRYWSFTDIAGMGITAIIERVRAHLAATNGAAS